MTWQTVLCVVVVLVVLLVAGVMLVGNLRRVPTGKVGIVHRRFGRNDLHEFSIRTGSAAGPQAATLRPDHFYLLPPLLYHVTYVDRTEVKPGTIGVVRALVGAQAPLDQTLCRHVECDSFQDGVAFLLGGGQMGRQPAVLPGGTYDINPLLFEVVTLDNIGSGKYGLTPDDLCEVRIPVGATGVVITQEGAPADDDTSVGPVVAGHASFQYPSVFLAGGGQRGAQAETLAPGVYRINPWFARVILIPTRDLILEWTKRPKSDDNYDVALEQIRVNLEGHWLRFDMSQTIRIPAKAAPILVGRFGEVEAGRAHPGVILSSGQAPVQRFVERVLGRVVENYFHAIAGGQTAQDFIRRHDQVRLDLEERVRTSLATFGVEAINTALSEFESESDFLDEFRRDRARRRDEKELLEWDRINAAIQAEIDRIAVETEGQQAVAELRALVALLGKDVVAGRLLIAELKGINVPTWVGEGSKHVLPMTIAHDVIGKVLRQAGMDSPRSLPEQAIPVDGGRAVEPPRPQRRRSGAAAEPVVSWDDEDDGAAGP
jgi:hypothetical protein